MVQSMCHSGAKCSHHAPLDDFFNRRPIPARRLAPREAQRTRSPSAHRPNHHAERDDYTLMMTAPAPRGSTMAPPADDFARLDAYWRASNYLAVGQIYLLDNPLL